MTYNTSEIMIRAWKDTKMMMKVMGYWPSQLRKVFAGQLKFAWARAKKATGKAVLTAKEISFQIMRLECKDTLQVSDFKKLDDLRAAHRAAFDRESTATKLAA
jgi:hypothetical protein